MITTSNTIDRISKTRSLLIQAIDDFYPAIALASSFSMEDIVLIDMASTHPRPLKVFAIDTGRLHEETYEIAEIVQRRYNLQVHWFFPRQDAVEELESTEGVFSFRESVTKRQACCAIRKVEPLARALKGLSAWITGLRREQSPTRASIQPLEIDSLHGNITKVNPLADWDWEDVQTYVQSRHLPVNRLYEQGYASIGCAPCTRPIQKGDDLRAGRWWWENPEHKECGLHRHASVSKSQPSLVQKEL